MTVEDCIVCPYYASGSDNCPNCIGTMTQATDYNYSDLIVFDDQPKRQLKSPEIHND